MGLFWSSGSDWQNSCRAIKRGSGFLSTPCPYLEPTLKYQVSEGQHKERAELPWDDLAALECLPKILLDVIMRDVVADLFHHCHLPSQHLLIGEPVQGW